MNGATVLGVILIAIGLSAITDFNIFKFVFALLIIWWGWIILSGSDRKRKRGKGRYWRDFNKSSSYSSDDLNEVHVFSGAEKVVESDEFTGGRIVAVFGGADFDLSNVKTHKKEIELELVAVFGGVRVKVPQNWKIQSEVIGVAGGVKNETSVLKSSVVVHVTGVAFLGGVEIFN